MPINHQEQDVLLLLTHWAESQPLVRAMLLTSTRAIPNSSSDIFSDYDVILVLRDIHPFFDSRVWMEAFGKVLALYRDPLEDIIAYAKGGYVVQFEDGLKIDFTLWSVEILQAVVAQPALPDELDAGYRVLLDKDHLTEGILPPTYQAFIPKPPTQTEFHVAVECFFLDTIYFAKYLWRDDLVAARHIMETCLLQEYLRPMLEWQIELEHGWSVKPGPYGRGLKKWLRPEIWAALERTYTGPGLDENWQSLDNTITLFTNIARQVGDLLGYNDQPDIERRTLSYLHKLKTLPPGATHF
jgi:aminoglycoside 6-adenylyltransferase